MVECCLSVFIFCELTSVPVNNLEILAMAKIDVVGVKSFYFDVFVCLLPVRIDSLDPSFSSQSVLVANRIFAVYIFKLEYASNFTSVAFAFSEKPLHFIA
jgi:hypothetical protein